MVRRSTTFTFVKNVLPGELPNWVRVLKGESGWAQRQLKLANTANAAESFLRLSRGTTIKVKTGKTPAALAAERALTLTPAAQSKLTAARLKRRQSYEKKQKYKGEPIKDIREFEAFKAKRIERHTSEITGEEVGGRHTPEEYAKGKAFAEKHADVEADFLKYVESPEKKGGKGSKRRKLDTKGRNIRDMVRHLNKPRTRTTKSIHKKAA